MCADCHSTHLKKGYDEKEERYHTTYSAINVSCEACHGAGSEHVAWAKNPNANKGTRKKGLAVDLSAFGKKRWEIDEKSGKPVRLADIDRTEVQLCARCHSRRTQLDDDFEPGERFEEHYLPSILEPNLYFDDGKIKDEVYVYGSFLQSRMYAEGVTCSDCHDPHTLKRKAEGDRVCNRCHRRVTYDTPKHHFHPKGGAGCIDCHMPPRTYMGVDVRNDHSFRIPRPDLSVGSDIPNACNHCHKDKSAQWAAEVLKKQFGEIPKGKQDFAHAFKALRTRSETAPQSLYDVLMSDASDIAKATAATHLGDYPSQQTYMTIRQLLKRDDPMLRRSALRALESFPRQLRLNALLNMADDPVKSVRIEAARQLSGLPANALSSEQKQKRRNVIAEYERTLRFSAERAESQTGLGTLYANLGKDDAAEAAFEKALRLQPLFIPAYINYAHFLQTKGEEKSAITVLEKGLKRLPDAAALHHALGLWFVRAKMPTKALASLEKAAKLAPDDARYQYVYAVALAGTNTPEAIHVLEASLKHHSGDVDTLAALAYYHGQLGHTMQANLYRQRAERLQRFTPKIGH